MTPDELIAAARAKLKECGVGAYLQIVVTRSTRPRVEYLRAWPNGPLGRVVGSLGAGRYMIDVHAADVLRALGGIESDPM